MKIIASTPINLPNDEADVVNAIIYKELNGSLHLHIDYPTSPRVSDEFTNDDIDRLWEQQYPNYNKLLFT